MRSLILCILVLLGAIHFSLAQTASTPRAITLEEYTNAKTYDIPDLDNDHYAKFGNNQYIAERYEDKKPYFITGDDGKRKRVDLYSLSKKGEDFSLGLLIYYTAETGKRYIACLPNNFAPGPIWEKYFEDIHAIDKTEPNFVLKLSYILSRELSYSQYKSTHKGGSSDRAEAGTYGNDICFPGDDLVAMADGSSKLLKDMVAGDKITIADPQTGELTITTVTKLIQHKAANYAVTTVTLWRAEKRDQEIVLHTQTIQATPNHPVQTEEGIKPIRQLAPGDKLYSRRGKKDKMELFEVWNCIEQAEGWQNVYNMETSGGETFIINGVLVRQK